MGRKKIIIIIIVVVIIGGIVAIYYIGRGGFTKKAQYEECYEVCYDLMITETYKQACDEKCAEETGYNPTALEKKELLEKVTNTSTNTNTTKNTNVVKNTNTATNINRTTNVNTTVVDYEDLEYYCEWSWPQKIIDKDTEGVIKNCTSAQPWCDYADNTYENVGCCTDQEHTNCTTLPVLLGHVVVDPEDREYYCNWVWPQEIIDQDTEEVIYECPSSLPWCDYADGTYESVGCCADEEHTDCITLPDL